MIAPLRLALAVAAVAGGPLLIGCGSSDLGCTVSCPTLFSAATFILSCGATDMTNVAVSGPCASGDAALPYSLDSFNPQNLYVGSLSTGICHVELTFATGFTYSTDVTFTSSTQSGGCCPGTHVTPTVNAFMVNNPSTTCVDAGPEAGATDIGADAPTDAQSEAATGPQTDAGADE